MRKGHRSAATRRRDRPCRAPAGRPAGPLVPEDWGVGGVGWAPHRPGHVGTCGFPTPVLDPVAVLGRRGGRLGATRHPQACLVAVGHLGRHQPRAGLAGFRTLRVSGRQELITRRVSQVLGGAVDTTITQWATSHGDLHWGNITAPALYLLDWADWGLAPRGNDAASLWGSALAVPDTAERVHAEFRDDLDCRSGRIARLWVCSNILRMADQRADARDLAEPARAAAERLVTDLR